MTTIKVRHNFPAVAKRLEELERDVGEKALTRSMNRVLEQARTQMAKEITKEFAIPSSKVKERLQIRRAWSRKGKTEFVATLYVASKSNKSRSMNVIGFSAKEIRRGVTVKIKKTGGRKLIGHAFIANQGRTVFVRKGPKRLPVQPVSTIGVPQMFNTRRINSAVVQMINAKLPEVFAREVKYYLGAFAR